MFPPRSNDTDVPAGIVGYLFPNPPPPTVLPTSPPVDPGGTNGANEGEPSTVKPAVALSESFAAAAAAAASRGLGRCRTPYKPSICRSKLLVVVELSDPAAVSKQCASTIGRKLRRGHETKKKWGEREMGVKGIVI